MRPIHLGVLLTEAGKKMCPHVAVHVDVVRGVSTWTYVYDMWTHVHATWTHVGITSTAGAGAPLALQEAHAGCPVHNRTGVLTFVPIRTKRSLQICY